jgi:hypothetical protein
MASSHHRSSTDDTSLFVKNGCLGKMEEEQGIQQRETDILSLVSPNISTDAR